MTNGEKIRTLDNEGIASLILCAKCWIRSKGSCENHNTCPKWREYVEWLGEEVGIVECRGQNQNK